MSKEKNESRSSVSSGTKQEKEAVKSEAPTPLASSTPQIQTPYSLQFWDKAPEIGKARKIYITILLQRTLIIVLAIFGIFSIYWGALWQLPARSLEGWIVDFDEDRVGHFMTEELSKNTAFEHLIHWHIQPAANFPNGPVDLVSALLNERCWLAISINQNVSSSLNQSSTDSAEAYDPSQAITVYGAEARNENSYRTLLRPTVTTLLDGITHDFAVQTLTNIIRSNAAQLSTIPPDILTRPVYFTVQNLHPFDVPVATAVTFIGLIYLLILSFIVVNAGILARSVSGIEKKLTTGSLIRVRLVSPILVYLVVSLAYSLLTRAFKLPFDRHFGNAGFVLFWMLSWFGMMAAGLALESMMTLLTIKYIQVFLVLWIIGNVSVCLWPIDALPVLYNYGHAAPFYQISRGVRSIVFGTKNELGMNFGILSVWIAISACTLPLFQWYRRREEKAVELEIGA